MTRRIVPQIPRKREGKKNHTLSQNSMCHVVIVVLLLLCRRIGLFNFLHSTLQNFPSSSSTSSSFPWSAHTNRGREVASLDCYLLWPNISQKFAYELDPAQRSLVKVYHWHNHLRDRAEGVSLVQTFVASRLAEIELYIKNLQASRYYRHQPAMHLYQPLKREPRRDILSF